MENQGDSRLWEGTRPAGRVNRRLGVGERAVAVGGEMTGWYSRRYRGWKGPRGGCRQQGIEGKEGWFGGWTGGRFGD